jgi:hypothetical protein
MLGTLGIVLVIKEELTLTLVRRSIYHLFFDTSLIITRGIDCISQKLPRLNFGQKIQMLFIKYKL